MLFFEMAQVIHGKQLREFLKLRVNLMGATCFVHLTLKRTKLTLHLTGHYLCLYEMLIH